MKLLKTINALNLIALVLFSWTFQAYGTDRQPLTRKNAVGTGALAPGVPETSGKQSLQRTEKVQRPNTYGILKECNPHLCTQATCGQVYQFLSHCYGCTHPPISEGDWIKTNPETTFAHCKTLFCTNNPGFCHAKTPLEGLTLTDTMAMTREDRPLYICTIPLVEGASGAVNINALNSTDFQFLSQTDDRIKGTLENLINGFIHFEKLGVNTETWIQNFDAQNKTQIARILQKVSHEKLTPEEVGECALLVEHIRSNVYHKLQIPVIVMQSAISGNKTIPKTISKIGCISE